MLLDWLDQGPGMRPACAKKNKLKKYLDKIEEMDYIKTMKTLEEYNEEIQDLKKRQARYLSEDCRIRYGEKMTQYSIGLFDKLISEVMSERAKLIGKK